MKTKELIQLIAALVIFAVAGFLIYLQVAPHNAGAGATNGPSVEVVSPINADFDQDALSKVSDGTISRDFYQAPDLNSGLGNSQVFGPLR